MTPDAAARTLTIWQGLLIGSIAGIRYDGNVVALLLQFPVLFNGLIEAASSVFDTETLNALLAQNSAHPAEATREEVHAQVRQIVSDRRFVGLVYLTLNLIQARNPRLVEYMTTMRIDPDIAERDLLRFSQLLQSGEEAFDIGYSGTSMRTANPHEPHLDKIFPLYVRYGDLIEYVGQESL